MGASNSPFQEDKLKDIINSVNNKNGNNIVINRVDMMVNGQEINFQRSKPSDFEQMKIPQKKENNEPVFLTISIQSEFGKLQLQVNSNETVGDIIEKYKNKLQNDNIKNISFHTENYGFLEANKQLKDYNLQNNSIINAKIEYKQNENKESQNKTSSKENNIKKEKQFSNREIPSEELNKIREIMISKLKIGLITVVIKSSCGDTRFFYAKPNIKFKIIEEEFKNYFPDKNWIFLFNGLIVDSEKTLKELNIGMLSVIVATDSV
jgi:hypothetical protein